MMTRLDYTIVSSVSAPTTLDQNYRIVLVTNGSTITLPNATDPANRQILFNIVRTGTSAVLVNTTSAQTINGALTLTLTSQYDSVTIVSDGANWVTISRITQSGGDALITEGGNPLITESSYMIKV